MAYIGSAQTEQYGLRYATDMQSDSRWGRYQWSNTADHKGFLRILRKGGEISTWYWLEDEWIRLDQFGGKLENPVYFQLSAGNNWDSRTPATWTSIRRRAICWLSATGILWSGSGSSRRPAKACVFLKAAG